MKKYISTNVLDGWFNEYDEDKEDWVVTEIMENLFNALADTNQLLKECSDESEKEKLHSINNGIVSVLTDIRQLVKEVEQEIKNGNIIELGAKKGERQ